VRFRSRHFYELAITHDVHKKPPLNRALRRRAVSNPTIGKRSLNLDPDYTDARWFLQVS
jgi:hypothetical protein